ncbi:MAG: cytochrome c [Deltaproteobacteria bacterium]|nr:cytochrome c [Deltaproteobacteria bacterium]
MNKSMVLIVAFLGSTWCGVSAAAGGFGSAADGRELFLDKCAMCHGKDARGKDGMAPDFLKEWHRFSQSDDVLAEHIRRDYRSSEGFYMTGSCPPHNLTNAEMNDLLEYIRELVDSGGHEDPFFPEDSQGRDPMFDRPF